jgi:hypothetical protein
MTDHIEKVDEVIEKAGGSPRTMLTTGQAVPADRSHTEIDPATGQQKAYVVLTPEERAKGYVRPVRRSYVHVGLPGPKYPLRDLTSVEQKRYSAMSYVKLEEFEEDAFGEGKTEFKRFWTQAQLNRVGKGCGAETRMSLDIAQSYARKPIGFYDGTFCATCRDHFPVGEDGEFVWSDNPDQRVGT